MAKKSKSSKKVVKKTAAKKVTKKAIVKKVVKKSVPKKATKSSVKKKSAKKVVAQKKVVVKKGKPAAIKNTQKTKVPAKTKKVVSPSKKVTPVKVIASKSTGTSKPENLALLLTPLDDRILVKKIEEEKMTPGGLYIPSTVSNVRGNLKGIVVAVGRGHIDKKGHLHPLDVRLGDHVLFSEHSVSNIQLNSQEYLFVRESEILGIVEKK